MAQVLRNGAVENKTASVQWATGKGCAAVSTACIVPWGKEKGRKLVEAPGLECGAGAGIEPALLSEGDFESLCEVPRLGKRCEAERRLTK